MFKIGDFSKLSFVSVKILRFYDEIGLLKPVKVVRFTGYMYYTANQLPQLNRVLMLKDLGLSLEEIARLFKEEVLLASILDIVKAKQNELKTRLKVESELLSRVEEWLEQFNKEGKIPDYEVVIKKMPPIKVSSVRDVVPTYHDITVLFIRYAPTWEDWATKFNSLAHR
jgi:DNA-binding transcriptional MerR regulator